MSILIITKGHFISLLTQPHTHTHTHTQPIYLSFCCRIWFLACLKLSVTILWLLNIV